jgi:hypothetical protein
MRKKVRHARKKISQLWKSNAREIDLGSPAKAAASSVCSEQDDKRFRFVLVAHEPELILWGKGARILAEINRLSQ